MNTKNLFTFNAITAVLFAIPMLLAPKTVADMYLTHPETADDATWVLMRGYGSLLLALTVCLWYIRPATPSRALKGILLLIFVGDVILPIVHIHAILNGVENNQAWGIVLVGVVLAVWSGLVLRKMEVGERVDSVLKTEQHISFTQSCKERSLQKNYEKTIFIFFPFSAGRRDISNLSKCATHKSKTI